MRKSFVFLAGILLVGSGIFVACSMEQAEAKPTWEVEGHWAEACQCDVVCPCLYGKPASHGTCNNSQVFQFDKGRYEDMVLDGFYVVLSGSIPESPEEGDAHVMSFSRVYVDERANEQQRQALVEIARALQGNLLAQPPGQALAADQAVETVPIEANLTLASADATIPDVLDFHTERLMKPESEEPWELTDAVMKVDWMPQMYVGKSTNYKYTGAREWEYSDRNALFGRFKANSDMPGFKAAAETSAY